MAVDKITIKKIFRDQVNTKFGPGVRTSIFAVEYPDVRMSSFTRGTETWKEGDKVSVEIQKNGEYTNFKPVGTSSGGLEERVANIEKQLGISPASEKTIDVAQQGDFEDF